MHLATQLLVTGDLRVRRLSLKTKTVATPPILTTGLAMTLKRNEGVHHYIAVDALNSR